MTQARLNHLMILLYHQDKIDQLKQKSIVNEYITSMKPEVHLLPFFLDDALKSDSHFLSDNLLSVM